MNGVSLTGIGIAGIAVAIIGGIQLGSIGAKPFHYDTASSEARSEFLASEAEGFSKSIQRSLVSASGVGASFKVRESKVEPTSRRITVNIDVSGYYNNKGFSKYRSKLSKAVLKVHCKKFAKSRLGANNVTLTLRFNGTKDGRQLANVNLSNGACSKHVDI